MADELLKNDGTKFLEMMEQLAERRMYREEMAANAMMEEDSEDEDDGSEDDEDSEDEDDEDEDDEEVSPRTLSLGEADSHSSSLKNTRWKKDVECSQSSPQGCSSNGYWSPIEKKLHKIDRCS